LIHVIHCAASDNIFSTLQMPSPERSNKTQGFDWYDASVDLLKSHPTGDCGVVTWSAMCSHHVLGALTVCLHNSSLSDH